MKTKHILIILSLISTLSVSCIREEVAEYINSSIELTARMEYEAETKTSLSALENGMYYPLWSAGDQIAVYADGDVDPSRFTLTTGEGTTIASFSGNRQGSDYLAVYPYEIAGKNEDGKISLTLPQIQTYVPDSFGQGAFPMIATGGSDGSLKFMNLCSVLKISFIGTAAIRSITVTANDKDTYLSGPALVDAADVKDFLSMAEGASNTVVLECKGAKVEETPDFHIVIPPQTYKGGLTLEIDAYTDTITKVIDADLVFERSQIRTVKGLELAAGVPDIIYDAVPDNEIWYKTENGHPAKFDGNEFNADIVSHQYEDGIWKIKFSQKVTHISHPSFINCDDWFTELILPDSIERIDNLTLGNGSKLTKFKVPDNLQFIDMGPCNLFRNYTLTELIGKNVSEDGRCIIVDDTVIAMAYAGLDEYTFPSGIKALGPGCCNSNQYNRIKKIIVPEGVKYIYDSAFMHNDSSKSALEYVYLPSTLVNIASYAFACHQNIKAFYGDNAFVSGDNLSLIVPNYNGSGYDTIVAFASGSDVTEYTIPDGVKAIESYCFYYATNLKKLNFPDSFETIFSGHAFEGTTNIEAITGKHVLGDGRSLVIDGKLIFLAGGGLESYVTPERVTSLGYMVLGFKDYLKEIIISDEVETCDGYGYIFNGNPSLETVTISARMSFLGYDPFGSINWQTPSLKTVYCRAVIPPVVYYNGGIDYPNYEFEDLTIYVPKESYDMYQSSAYWDIYERYLQPYDYGDLSEFYPDCYISTDYSSDGTVKTLQTATTGNGINIVLMGDGYSDRQIADGTYKADMEFVYRNLFTEEPYNSYQDMFNVNYVNVVSATEGYEYGDTALGCQFGEGTYVYGNDALCFEYAQNVVAAEDIDETLVIVVMNSDAYAGTCFMYNPSDVSKDYGSGASVAYFPKGSDKATFAQLLHHEACGHGFAKLADEYYNEGLTISDAEIMQLKNQNTWGWWKNTDFTSDPSQVKWAKFLADERYASEGLGVFEGAHTYQFGVYRPTDESIMRYNTGGFNAPSREAIYYRIHKLAYGDSWEYDYEKFVEYDAINRVSAQSQSGTSSQKRRANYVEKQQKPLAPPVIVGRTWK